MKKWLLSVSVLIVLVLLGWIFWLISRPQPLTKQETDQAIEQILGRPVRQETQVAETLTYQGKYFKISYPGTAHVFDLKNNDTPPKNQLEAFSLDVPNPKRVVTIIINRGNNLEDLSGYNFRNASTSGYLKKNQTINNQSVQYFSKSGSDSEITAFFQNGTLLMSMSITGRQLKEVQDLYDQLINQIDWSSTNSQPE